MFMVEMIFSTSIVLLFLLSSSHQDIMRLQSQVVPLHYDISLEFLSSSQLFRSKTQITMKVTRHLEFVIFHLVELDCLEYGANYVYNLNETESNSMTPVNITENGDETYRLDYDFGTHYLYKLEFDCLGSITQNKPGPVYRFEYPDEKKNGKKWAIVSQLGMTDARRVFPCFDEPHFKATFHLTVSLPHLWAPYQVLSNTEIQQKKIPHHKHPHLEEPIVFDFQTTPRSMSTYLLAFLISDFISTEPRPFVSDYVDEEPKLKNYKIWMRDNVKLETDPNEAIGTEVMEHLTKFFDIGYGFDKMDHVALPVFSFNAMENWGIITFRETALLSNKRTPQSYKQQILTTISHEATHQWFGDLVTCKWWDVTWLHEGMATFFGYRAGAEVYEAALLDLKHQFVVKEMQKKAMLSDAYTTAWSLNQEPTETSHIMYKFDNIAYSKGASVIRMFNEVLGENFFFASLKTFLYNMREQAATSDDFIKYIQQEYDDATMKPVLPNVPNKKEIIKTVMSGWLEQPGYPVVTVNNVIYPMLTFTQKRFYLESGNSSEAWYIPLTIATDDKDSQLELVWMTPHRSATYNLPTNTTWYLVNLESVGYFRVNYPPKNWNALLRLVQDHKQYERIPHVNRAQLLSDALNLAKVSLLDYSTALNFTKYLSHEWEFEIWDAAMFELEYLWRFFSQDKYFKVYVTSLLRNQFNKLGMEGQLEDTPKLLLLRELVTSWGCKLQLESCVNTAKELFLFVVDGTETVPEVIDAVYCTGIRDGGQAEFNFLSEKYSTTDDAIQQKLILAGLGCSDDNVLLQRHLASIVNDNGDVYPWQEKPSAVSAVYLNNPTKVNFTLSFILETINDSDIGPFENSFGASRLGSLLTDMARYIVTEDQLIILENIKKKIDGYSSKFDSLKTSLETAFTIVGHNADWKKQHYSTVQQWLIENQPSLSSPTLKLNTTLYLLFLIFLLINNGLL